MRNFLKHILLLIFVIPAMASGQQPDALVSFSTFTTPSQKSFVETYFTLNPNSLTYVKENNKFQAGAEVTVIIKDGDKIINFDKFNLLTEAVEDTTTLPYNLITQRRIAIPNGNYIMEVNFKDLNNPDAILQLPPQPVIMDFTDKIAVSDIALIESFEQSEDTKNPFYKNGFVMKPYVLNYFPTHEDKLHYYVEIYNLDKTHKDQDVVLISSIRKKGERSPGADFQQFSKQKGKSVNVVLGKFDISNLPTGEFELVMEVKDRGNNLLAIKKHGVSRSNKGGVLEMAAVGMTDITGTFVEGLTSKDLTYQIKTLKPIANESELRMISDMLALNDSLLMQQFMYNFWVTRDFANPEGLWKKYQVLVSYANQNFGTVIREGYETDRGRVYLKYGPPNDVDRAHYEGDSKPYEIWNYNRIPNNEVNVMFVFYNPDLISNDYLLLHSTATGEVKNDRWKLIIYDQKTAPLDQQQYNNENMGIKHSQPIKK